jgi:hypothetical protein
MWLNRITVALLLHVSLAATASHTSGRPPATLCSVPAPHPSRLHFVYALVVLWSRAVTPQACAARQEEFQGPPRSILSHGHPSAPTWWRCEDLPGLSGAAGTARLHSRDRSTIRLQLLLTRDAHRAQSSTAFRAAAGSRSGTGRVGSGQWAVGSGQWAVGSGQWAVGSGQWAVGSGQRGE